MRRSLLLASFTLAAFLAVPAGSIVGTAQAKESSGREWVDAVEKWKGDISRLSIRIRDYPLSPRYCRRPHREDKTFDEVSLNQLAEELALLTGEFSRIRTGTNAATQSTSGGTLLTNRQNLGEYPKYKGYEVTDDQHWIHLRRDYIGDAEKFLREKRAKLAAAPENFCGEPEKKKEEIIGGNPPLQPVEPAIPAPAYAPVSIPAKPPRFCSIDEKFAWLSALTQQRTDMIENEKRAYAWAQALQKGISAKRRDTAALNALRGMAIAQRDAYLAMEVQAAKLFRDVLDNMEVEKCGGEAKKEIGSLPGGWSAGIETAYGEIKIPKKPYLALEVAPGNLRLGVVELGRTDMLAAMYLAITHDLDFLPVVNIGNPYEQRWMTAAEIFGYKFSLSSNNGEIDTTTEGVGIPGTGDPSAANPAGVFLALPALNDVTDIDFRHVSQVDGLSLSIGQKSSYSGWNSTFAFGLSYERQEISEDLGGTVTGYLTDFEYRTDLENAIWGLFVATEAEISLDLEVILDRPQKPGRSQRSGVFLGVDLRGGLNFVNAEGRDRLDLTGFISDSQSVRLSKEDTTFSYLLGASLKYVPPGVESLELSIGARYGEADTHPVIHRSGEVDERSRIEFETQEEIFADVGINFSF